MDFDFTSDWDGLFSRLDKLGKANVKGKAIMARAAQEMDGAVRNHLSEQGRGGYPPPLADMTKQIYKIDGQPDGSGIVNHLELSYFQIGNKYTACLGIPTGKPTMIARVQNNGCIIQVTDKMRGFLAAQYGIFLRAETTHITIPGRKFWDESIQYTRSRAIARLKTFFADALD